MKPALLALALAVIGLAGCATPAAVPAPALALRVLPPLTQFGLEGRLQVRDGERSAAVGIDWQHGPARDEWLFTGPLGQGLALTPGDPFIIDSLGWVLYRRGDLGGALEQLQKAFGLRADPEIAAHLGEVLWMLGRRDEAARVWKDAAKANPDNPVLADVIKKFKP